MRRPVLVAAATALVLVPVLALHGQSTSDQPHGDLKLDCAECHNPEKWVPVGKPPTFRHGTTGFALESAHAQVSCRGCHRTLEFNQVGTACADCHKDAHRGELGASCEACHTPATWTNQREMFQVHSRTRFPLFASHSRLDCTACHRNQQPYQYKTTPAECGNCHLPTYLGTTNPSHVQSGFSRRCEDCHNVTSPTWRSARFSHPESFPLAGGHSALACARCHTSGSYAGTSSACVSCHQATYAATTNPNHLAGRIPTTCENCHTIGSWRPAKFDHEQTRFPLTGAHSRTDCARCHAGGRYTGTPTDCYSCHQTNYASTTNPNHQASAFPTQCQTCHTTSAWRPATSDHNKTRFPLTGAHQRVDCARCHVGGRYTGTPTDCNSCHQANYAATTNPNHRSAGFPVTCQDCHTTSAWKPASFDHDGRYFPIYSGKHRGKWTSCSECHVSAGNYKAFECILCHEHSNKAKVDSDHRGERGYAYASTSCYQCHRNGNADARGGFRRLP
jgi:Zn finger protein HypA/HybF involved in hydrogenase expression